MPAVKMRVALVALLATALAGCSSASGGPATNGPLNSGAGKDGKILPHGGGVCVGRLVSRLQAFGDVQFTNYGHTTVVLDRVVLMHPHNQRLIGSYAVPGERLIGTVPWPPNYPSDRGLWKTRQPVRGYRVAPGKEFNMVLGATYAGPGFATSQGMRVYYHDAAGSYVAANYFAMQIAVTSNRCPD